VVDEAVDHGGGDGVVAEDLAPAAEGFVAGDDDAGPFVSGGDHVEEQVRGIGVEWDVADFVDDDEWVAGEVGQFVGEPVGVVSGPSVGRNLG